MNAAEIKLAASMARDLSVDLSGVDDSILYGFGLPDFQPVTVGVEVVAKCMRWQCSYAFTDGWDDRQFNEDLPYYRRNVSTFTLLTPLVVAFLQNCCVAAIAD